MTEWLWRQLTGWVNVCMQGVGTEKVISEVTKTGHKMWKLRRDKTGAVYALVSRSTVSILHRAAVAHRVRVHFLDRGGIGWLSKRAKGRPLLPFGFIAAVLGVVWLTSRIWVVDAPIVGQPAKVRQELVQAAYSAGLTPGIAGNRVALDQIAVRMEQELPGYFWIRLSRHGIVAEIQAARMVARPPYRPPSRLVASASGKILQVDVYMGESMVSPGEFVNKGQTLIQGSWSSVALGAPSSDGRVRTPAVGQVWANVVHRVSIYQPFLSRIVVRQRQYFVRRQLFIDRGPSFVLSLGHPNFRQYRVRSRTTPIIYRGVELPLKWRKVVYNEIKMDTRYVSVRQATGMALAQATREVSLSLPTGARWLRRKRQVKRVKRGVWVTLTWHAAQDVAIAPGLRPIGQPSQDP